MNINTSCSLNPYFKIHPGMLEEFKSICDKFILETQKEKGVSYYFWCFDNNNALCREGFRDIKAVSIHLKNTKHLLDKALEIADLVKLEVYGIKSDLSALKEIFHDKNVILMEIEKPLNPE